jgi:hypothetical protein
MFLKSPAVNINLETSQGKQLELRLEPSEPSGGSLTKPEPDCVQLRQSGCRPYPHGSLGSMTRNIRLVSKCC